MADFYVWKYETLVLFATESQAKILEQEETIKELRDQLRVAIDAYRHLVIKAAGQSY